MSDTRRDHRAKRQQLPMSKPTEPADYPIERSSAVRSVARIFDSIAPGYDNAALRFSPFCADYLVDRLDLKPGVKLLDIATGTGVVAIAAAQRLRPDGRVTAIDISARMLDKAQQNINKMALSNIDLHEMDAEGLEFRSEYFDVVVSSFGMPFLQDTRAALKQWLRVCKPGGRVIFTTFGNQVMQPMRGMFESQLVDMGIRPEVVESAIGLAVLSSEQECLALLREAGLGDISAETRQLGYHLNNENEWWDVVWNSIFRGVLEGLDQTELGRFKAQHLTEVKGLVTEKGLWLDVPVIFSEGYKPRD